MKIGIMVLSIGSFGMNGFYNLQEIGLARALGACCNKVKVYKLVLKSDEDNIIDITDNVAIQYMPSKHMGTNGIPKMKLVDKDLDVLICFSDTQLMLPMVYKWAVKNSIKFIPYIGVADSHSINKIKSIIIDTLFYRNIRVYRKCICMAKNLEVSRILEYRKVKNVELCPVGLDIELMKQDYDVYSIMQLKEKYGYSEGDKIILYIGRMTEEKQPMRMLDIFENLYAREHNYKLLMIGTGKLLTDVMQWISYKHMEETVHVIEKIENKDIWEIYRIADCLINLNHQEIFGMALLEAMYYGCKVIAWRAPGPNLIIENGVSGWLVGSNEEVIEKILNTTDFAQSAHQRVIGKFTWDNVAIKINDLIIGGGIYGQ